MDSRLKSISSVLEAEVLNARSLGNTSACVYLESSGVETTDEFHSALYDQLKQLHFTGSLAGNKLTVTW